MKVLLQGRRSQPHDRLFIARLLVKVSYSPPGQVIPRVVVAVHDAPDDPVLAGGVGGYTPCDQLLSVRHSEAGWCSSSELDPVLGGAGGGLHPISWLFAGCPP